MAYVGTFLAVALGWVSDEVYQAVTIGVIGLYMFGNVGEHFANKVAGGGK